jgi:hypothetical protein
VLAVVQHQQAPPAAEPLCEPGRFDAHRAGHDPRDHVGVDGAGEVTEPGSAMVATQPVCKLERQPRLAAAARSCQGDQAAARAQGAGLGKLRFAADEAGELDWQAAHRTSPYVTRPGVGSKRSYARVSMTLRRRSIASHTSTKRVYAGAGPSRTTFGGRKSGITLATSISAWLTR